MQQRLALEALKKKNKKLKKDLRDKDTQLGLARRDLQRARADLIRVDAKVRRLEAALETVHRVSRKDAQ